MSVLDGNTRYIYLLEAQFSSDGREEEWNRWYDTKHVPELLSVPGFVSARRYRAMDDAHSYLAAYEIVDPAVFEDPRYREVTGWGDWAQHIVAWRRSVFQVSERVI